MLLWYVSCVKEYTSLFSSLVFHIQVRISQHIPAKTQSTQTAECDLCVCAAHTNAYEHARRHSLFFAMDAKTGGQKHKSLGVPER